MSRIHGFMVGDSPDLGAKMIVMTNGDKEKAKNLDKSFACEVYDFRGRTWSIYVNSEQVIWLAQTAFEWPQVIADLWDNSGGGTAGSRVDRMVKVLRNQAQASQSFGDSIVPIGDASVIKFDGIEVVLTSNRALAFSPDLFTNMDIDTKSKKFSLSNRQNIFRAHLFQSQKVFTWSCRGYSWRNTEAFCKGSERGRLRLYLRVSACGKW